MIKQDYDLVVVGSGVAGLSCAVSALERGFRVAVLERSDKANRGGQSRWTEAYLRMKSKSDVTDDFDTFLAENGGFYQDPDYLADSFSPRDTWPAMARVAGSVDVGLIGAFVDAVPETIEWLEAQGVRFDFLPTQFLTSTQPRLLPVGGGEAIVETLAQKAEAMGAEFYYQITARELVTEGMNTVVGVRAWSEECGEVHLSGQVMLACGGFQGNAEMLAQYMGDRAAFMRPVCKAGAQNRGEGIAMASAVGAATAGNFANYHAEPVDPRSGISEPSIFVFPYGILVNKGGVRFSDEAPGTVDAWYERISRRILAQEEGLAWVILDQKVNEVPNYKLSIRTDQPAITGNTIAELAHEIGVCPETLEQTVASYNAACVEGEYRPLELDALSTQNLYPPKSNWARRIDQGPFMAYPIISANVFTFGGLKIDEQARVVNTSGMAIDGLYAAGEITGMYVDNYCGGTSVLRGLVFGRQAGVNMSEPAEGEAA